ncbi:MAG: GPO family capsid scaffolding protein [Pseudacidovorax sp.]|uniref:GPO family capsid scaffolding protein n=1 Tax=Pseudacidovorax sp. TaxID=1934311 RepID=UPI001B653EED|nr:GPO family capsid scaffolding protein [Pseudacidovorax sp.]MBP6894341.1 GPO family capsid scaffolding protein [Pseudacidovorax sp.]
MSTPAAAKKVSKFFRVAVEGATSDGRVIDRQMLEQIAASYDPNVYGARINIEHIRGYSPNSDFKAYGDVLAVKTEQVDIGGVKKLALFAQISPTDELVALTKARQKIYSSMEVRPRFADTEKAYLTGLAVTDNPASLGTEVLAFAAQNPNANPFKGRKQQADDLFTVAEEAAIEFEDVAAPDAGIVEKFKTAISGALAKFGAKTATDDARFAAVAEGFEQLGEAFAAHAGEATKQLSAAEKTIAELQATVKDLQAKYSALDNTPATTQRPAANGGNGLVPTDC